jgi:hypothetical protein
MRWTTWFLALQALALAMPTPSMARHHRRSKVHGHAWQRPLGHRLQTWRRRTRQEKKRFRYGRVRPTPISPERVIQRMEDLRTKLARDPRARGAVVSRVSARSARYPVYRVDIPALRGRRGGPSKPTDKRGPLRVVVSSWLHGDEPVGQHAAEKLIRYALSHPDWRDDKDLRFVIKVDPFGTRDTPDGVNVNRILKSGQMNAVARDITRAVGRRRYGLALDLHASTYPGSFLIQLADYGNLTRRIASAMRSYSLLDASPSVGRYVHPNEPAKLSYRLSAPGVATVPGVTPGPQGLGSMMEYMGASARYSLTVEASQAVPATRRVKDMVKLVRSAIDNTLKYGDW